MSSILNWMTEITSPSPRVLARRRADKGPGGIVIEEAGVEDSGDVEADVFWDHAEGSEFALGELPGPRSLRWLRFLRPCRGEDDGRHGGLALVDGG